MIIGIAGVGGIGSNVAVHLVRSGFRRLTIVDHDRVEAGNLNRQFYFEDQIGRSKAHMLAVNLKRIAADTVIDVITHRLDRSNMASIFSDCEVVVEGMDKPADKKDLLEALTDTGQAVVSACGIAGSRTDGIRCRRMGNCTIVGDFITDCRDSAVYSHKVAVIAAIMAGVVIERSVQGG